MDVELMKDGLHREGPVLVIASEEDTEREDMLDIQRCRNSVMEGLSSAGYDVAGLNITPADLQDLPSMIQRIRDSKPVCIFNLFEGFSGKAHLEREFCRILEHLEIPFTGNTSAALGKCLNKGETRRLLRKGGIAVPRGYTIASPGQPVPSGLGYPIFIKPACEDGSVGIDLNSIIYGPEELKAGIEEKLLLHPSGLVVEEFIPGREFNVAFLGNGPYEVQSVSVLDYGNYGSVHPFLGYDSKWDPSSPDYSMSFIELDEIRHRKTRDSIVRIASKAGRILGCRGYFRVDLRERDGKFYVLDVNPNPDINIDSGFARQSRYRGYSYPRLLEQIIALALETERNDHEIQHTGIPEDSRIHRNLYA